MTSRSINTLKQPPVPGKFYMAPSLKFKWDGYLPEMFWPVIGPPHNDVQFFNFAPVHWHVDIRFLTQAHILQTLGVYQIEGKPIPLDMLGGQRPVMRRFRCRQEVENYQHFDSEKVENLNAHFADRQAIKGQHGWVCPHQAVPLGSIAPDADGIITCPLHGLRIDAASGRCAGAHAKRQMERVT